MAKSVVGIDISSTGLRAVELSDPAKSRPTLVRHREVSLPAGAVARGEVLEPRTVATALKQLWSVAGFKTKDVVLGIGNSRVLARDLSVPQMSLRRIRESLPFQVQDMLPFPTEDALLDFYPISEGVGENGPVVNGLLVAAVKDAVLGNVRAVQLAGLNPIEVDLVPFALSRILLRGDRAAGTTAIIDVGGSTTTVIVSSGGVPQFVRLIPTGGDELTNALANRMSISVEQAEAMKRSIGLNVAHANPDQRDAVSTIFEVASELIASLRNTLSYFAGSRPTEVVAQIILTGGASRLSGFPEAVSEFTRLPVTAGSPFDGINVSPGVDREALQAHGDSLSVALGLALGSAR